MTNHETIQVSQLDMDFKYAVAKRPGGEGILSCFQCDTCSAGCPIGAIDERFNPRKIIRMVLLGMKEELIKSDFIWLCTACHTCQEACPQGVTITDLMEALQNIAVENGHVPPAHKTTLNLLQNNGRIYEMGEFENMMRKKMGLPEIKMDATEIEKLIKALHLESIAEGG